MYRYNKYPILNNHWSNELRDLQYSLHLFTHKSQLLPLTITFLYWIIYHLMSCFLLVPGFLRIFWPLLIRNLSLGLGDVILPPCTRVHYVDKLPHWHQTPISYCNNCKVCQFFHLTAQPFPRHGWSAYHEQMHQMYHSQVFSKI